MMQLEGLYSEKSKSLSSQMHANSFMRERERERERPDGHYQPLCSLQRIPHHCLLKMSTFPNFLYLSLYMSNILHSGHWAYPVKPHSRVPVKLYSEIGKPTSNSQTPCMGVLGSQPLPGQEKSILEGGEYA